MLKPLIFAGIVIVGHKRGKRLGFPTANMELSTEIPEGIYLSETELHGQKYPALTFIGAAKTFNNQEYLAETYILDFDQDIYHKHIQVKLIKKIRDNQQFESVGDLIAQMKKDEAEAREYFNNV